MFIFQGIKIPIWKQDFIQRDNQEDSRNMEAVPSLPLLTLNFKGYWGRAVLLYVANVHVHTDFFAHKCCCCSAAKSCPTLCDPMNCMQGFPVLHYLPEFAKTHVCYVSDAIQSSHPLLPLSFLPSVFPSTRVFSNELALHIRWPKYWSFNFSPSSECSGLTA